MKLNAVSVSSKDLKSTVQFYELFGFEFPKITSDEDHVESLNKDSIRLMIDSSSLLKEILGEAPHPGNHSSFAIEYSTPAEVNETVEKIKHANFTVIKEPWDAFWGQRYAIVIDPDGYKVDLYASL